MSDKKIQGTRLLGGFLFMGTILGTLFLGGNLFLFIDLPALVFVCGTTFGLLFWVHGTAGLRLLSTLLPAWVGARINPDPSKAAVARAGARYALAAGATGTLIGVLQMLATLDDPSKVGGGTAAALLTMLYAVVLAEFVLNPLASRLDENSTLQNGTSATASARGIAAASVALCLFIALFVVNGIA